VEDSVFVVVSAEGMSDILASSDSTPLLLLSIDNDGHVDDEEATGVDTADNPNAASAGTAPVTTAPTATTLRLNLASAYNDMNNQSKFIVSFLAILIGKLLVDYLVRLALMFSLWYSCNKVKEIVHTQIYTQSRTSTHTFLLLSIWMFIDTLGYSEELTQHLLFFTRRRESATVVEVVWNSLVADVFVQLIAQQGRIGVCLTSIAMRVPRVSSVLHELAAAARSITGATAATTGATTTVASLRTPSRLPQVDLETGTITVERLSRRTTNTADHNHNQQQERLLHHESPSDESIDDVDTWDTRFKQNGCKLIDLASLLYRSVLPVSLWIHYFDHGETSSLNLFALMYLLNKFYNVSLTAKGAMQVIDHMINKKLEYGHYSTLEEYNSASSSLECPVCFDSPKQPVTLECKHIFCESCINQWLEKEKTCPVCRAEVLQSFPLMKAVRLDAASNMPLVV
jgi:hypothetical protein